MDCVYRYPSPIGSITMASNGTALTGLWFDGQKYFAQTLSGGYEEKLLPVFEDTIKWLDYTSAELFLISRLSCMYIQHHSANQYGIFF